MTRSEGRTGRWPVVVAAMVAVLVPLGCKPSRLAVRPSSPPAAPSAPVEAAALAEAGMEVLWRTEAPMPEGRRLVRLWLAPPYLLALDSGNQLYLMDASTGVRRWWRQVAKDFQTVERPTVYKGKLWVPTTTDLWNLQADNGEVLDKQPLEFLPTTGCEVNGIHAFMGGGNGWLQAVSISPERASWGRRTDQQITSRPVLAEGNVYFASYSGEIFASQQNIRRIVWQFQADGPVAADLKMTDNYVLLVASLDYSVYAFEAYTGRLAWQFDSGEPIEKPAYPYDGQVYVFTKSRGLRALDETTGQDLWQLDRGADFIGGADNAVYVRGRDGCLLVVRRKDGHLTHTIPTAVDTLAALNETGDGMVYLATPDGQILAATKKTTPAADNGFAGPNPATR